MAYQNELEMMMAGRQKSRKAGSYSPPQQQAQTDIRSVGQTSTPMQQPQPQIVSPGTDKNGMRHYRGPGGQIVSTDQDTLPQGATWVKWQERQQANRWRPEQAAGWIDMQANDPGYVKPETADEKKIRLAKEAQESYAKQFRNELGQNEQRLLGQLGQDTSSMIEQGTKSIREAASSRGLLKSGMRAGAEGGLRQKASSAMATGAQSIRRGLLSQADKLDAQAIQSGIDIQQNQQAMNDAIYRQALGEYQSEMGMWGSLLQAGSTAAAIALL